MTGTLCALIDGNPVPLSECDYVMLAACGCPVGMTLAGERFSVITEADAWKALGYSKTGAERERRLGFRMELMTHARNVIEVLPLFGKCPHETTGETP